MGSIHRALLASASALALLSGCNYDVTGSGAGSSAPSVATSGATGSGGGGSGPAGFTTVTATPPTSDAVNATPSVSGTVSVVAGASQTITIAFTSADGRPISGLALSNTTLPAAWSGSTDFTCTVTGSGNNCVLTLTYAPTTTESGMLAIGYVYKGDANSPPLITLNIPYAGTTTNNVIATAAPIGQINAAAGTGTQSVSVNFTSDDGNTATGLSIATDLSALPAGWSTSAPAFTCAIISNGSGCQLVLTYAPTVAGSGTLTLSYRYTDGSGAARTGAINLPYSTTVSGNVVATVSPTGQVNAIEKTGTQAVTLTFTTDDGQPASDLVMLSANASLPAGWSGSVSSFTCATVSKGNACQLQLAYAPTALTGGTVALDYGYMSASGTYTTGFVNIPYAATTNDNVVATAAPSGPIAAIVGEVNPAVAISFTTDDARTATDLQLTTDLTTLPAGWTSADSSFSCAGVDGATTCQLPLTYTPSAAASGTVTLRYTYLNNAGQAKSGSVNVPYRATTDDTVAGTPSSGSVAVLAGTATPLTVTFVTNDGNPASALSVSSGLTALPAGWSTQSSTFTCSSVSAGTVCQLALTYQPMNAGAGTLTLGFTYTNDSGSVKSGTVSIPYQATTNDTVVGTPSPLPLAVTAGTSTVVTIAFATDDGNAASALSVTSGLTALPAGWSSTVSTFACSSVSAGTACQIPLTYQPTGADSGTLQLGFSYTNDSGAVKSGTVSIPYTATP
jgi:hypothetical protein